MSARRWGGLGALILLLVLAGGHGSPAQAAQSGAVITIQRDPMPPACVAPGGVEHFSWTITFSDPADDYTYDIHDNNGTPMYGPFTVNIQGQPSPVTGSDSWTVPANAVPGLYIIQVSYSYSTGLAAGVSFFNVCDPATATPAPPTLTATPIPPSNTATRTAIPPSATPTRTRVPPSATATRTPTRTPVTCSVCNVYIADVNIACNPDGSVHWDALVRNNAACTVVSPWRSDLKQQRNYSDHWTTVATQTGTASFPPGDTHVTGDFAPYVFPANTTFIRTRFRLTSSERACNPDPYSPMIEPCLVGARTLTPTLTRTATATHPPT
jgi:hypothetical protein